MHRQCVRVQMFILRPSQAWAFVDHARQQCRQRVATSSPACKQATMKCDVPTCACGDVGHTIVDIGTVRIAAVDRVDSAAHTCMHVSTTCQ